MADTTDLKSVGSMTRTGSSPVTPIYVFIQLNLTINEKNYKYKIYNYR
jgi:hypothetical protein